MQIGMPVSRPSEGPVSCFEPEVRRRAAALLEAGAVALARVVRDDHRGTLVEGLVRGEGETSYAVRALVLQHDPPLVSGYCDCERTSRCEHALATLLQVGSPGAR